MKLKYYMRGIGIAMVVTALLVGFSYRNQETGMTDDEIMDRAKELGLIENTFLQPQVEPKETVEPENSPEPKEPTEPEVSTEPEASTEPETSAEPEETKKPETSAEPEETKEPETSAEPEVSETVEFEIRRGDSSDSVSRRLAEAGLVADAKEYDRYLCENGYDKRISVGIFEIPTDADDVEIARIITKQKNME